MEIIKVAPESVAQSPLEKYQLVAAPGLNLAKVGLESFRVRAWALFTDGESDRKREVLAIVDEEGNIYRTISATFKRSFINIVENFVEFPVIAVQHGESKNGRGYIDCVMVGE